VLRCNHCDDAPCIEALYRMQVLHAGLSL
jgi:hypothetical protein